jgi:hypothetical protein
VKVFGVGCIWFAPASEAEQKSGKRDEFLAQLKVTLERLENISNVSTRSLFDKPYMNHALIEKGQTKIIVPILHGCSLSFDLYLPYRVQETIQDRLPIENLKIHIHYGYEMPVVYVVYEHPESFKGLIAPSMAIVVIRKFLEQKLAGSDMLCGCVGPSPFHADFRVVPDPSVAAPELRNVTHPHRGYGEFDLVLPSDDDIHFLKTLFQYRSVFSKFYHFSNLRVRALGHQEAIMASAKNLVTSEPKDVVERVIESYRQSKPIDSMNRHIVSERLVRMELENGIEESDREELSSPGTPLAKYFETYRGIAKRSTWSEFSDVAKFFEDRRHHVFRNMTAVMAGIIGGVVGALLGSLLTFALTVGK